MVSQVDASIPADGSKPDKADFRANFATIKREISALQVQTEMASVIAFGTDAEFDL